MSTDIRETILRGIDVGIGEVRAKWMGNILQLLSSRFVNILALTGCRCCAEIATTGVWASGGRVWRQICIHVGRVLDGIVPTAACPKVRGGVRRRSLTVADHGLGGAVVVKCAIGADIAGIM